MRTLTLIVGILVAFPANAGSVRLTASKDFCRVIITVGNNSNPDTNPVEWDGPMSKGQSTPVYSGSGIAACYRRENDPGNCSSAVGISYTCCSNPASGVDNCSID